MARVNKLGDNKSANAMSASTMSRTGYQNKLLKEEVEKEIES